MRYRGRVEIRRCGFIAAVSAALCLAGSMATAGGAPPASQPAAPQSPSPELRPQEVVRIIVEALRRNDANDSGIRTTWNFASPGNKLVTGPLERFIPLVKNPLYAPLLHYQSVRYGELRNSDTQAAQLVELTSSSGSHAWYLFELTKQSDGPLRNCWMTDGVMRVRPQRPAPGDRAPTTQPRDTPPVLPPEPQPQTTLPTGSLPV
jgi:hypothetical protein